MSRRRKVINFLDLGDLMIPTIWWAMLLFALWAVLAGCCYGKVSDLPWAVVMVNVDSQPCHPVQLYALGV